MTGATEGAEARLADAGGELAFGLDAPLHEVMRTMRAIRRLRPDPVDDELLEQLVQAATWAPSASDAQAYSWLIVTDREQMRRLAGLWSRCFELYCATVAQASAAHQDPRALQRTLRAAAYQRDHFAEVPALLVACYDLAWQRRALRRRLPVLLGQLARLGPGDSLALLAGARRAAQMAEAASVYPGVQNLLLTARALGLGATLTTFHLLLEPRFKQVLGIPRHIRTFALIPVGWPKGKLGPVRRRPVGEVLRWERWETGSARKQRGATDGTGGLSNGGASWR